MTDLAEEIVRRLCSAQPPLTNAETAEALRTIAMLFERRWDSNRHGIIEAMKVLIRSMEMYD